MLLILKFQGVLIFFFTFLRYLSCTLGSIKLFKCQHFGCAYKFRGPLQFLFPLSPAAEFVCEGWLAYAAAAERSVCHNGRLSLPHHNVHAALSGLAQWLALLGLFQACT